MHSSAELNPCRRYRYALWRHWGNDLTNTSNTVAFIGLNPSTADELEDDPTVRRCVGYARDWGFDGVVLVNLFAYRATSPADMKAQADPIGPKNDAVLLRYTQNVGIVVAAWGTHGAYRGRGETVANKLSSAGIPLWALKVTRDGHPGHPLYLRRDQEPFEWRPAPAQPPRER